VAVKVTAVPSFDGFWLELTVMLPEPACVTAKLPVCELLEPV
jgi:hypothetical protein